ncbi:hypothetical protein Lumi_061 [Xylophilus phage Lumi]|nr:hypothetical protein Lumi_061 [Xylophilus phage Lumi]
MSQKQVRYFGLHETEDGVQYLHQGREKAYNFISLSTPSPFSVVFDQKRKALCPHRIDHTPSHPDRNHWELFLRLYEDPLFREFLPLPKEHTNNVVYVNDPTDQLHHQLTVLSKLSSPVIPLVYTITRLTPEKVLEALASTNLAPLVLTGVQESQQRYVNELARESMSLPRRLILLGQDGIIARSPIKRLQTNLQDFDYDSLVTLPLESLGSLALRRYCRNEQINAPVVRKET